MSRWFSLILPTLVLWSCAPSSGIRLQDIDPARSYNAEYEKVLDAIRMYAMKEGFKLDRFETEYGTIIGHKSYSSGDSRRSGLDAMSQVIVMKLSVKRKTVQQTDLNAGFSFGGVHTTSTRDDEDLLVTSYMTLFDFLNEELTP